MCNFVNKICLDLRNLLNSSVGPFQSQAISQPINSLHQRSTQGPKRPEWREVFPIPSLQLEVRVPWLWSWEILKFQGCFSPGTRSCDSNIRWIIVFFVLATWKNYGRNGYIRTDHAYWGDVDWQHDNSTKESNKFLNRNRWGQTEHLENYEAWIILCKNMQHSAQENPTATGNVNFPLDLRSLHNESAVDFAPQSDWKCRFLTKQTFTTKITRWMSSEFIGYPIRILTRYTTQRIEW